MQRLILAMALLAATAAHAGDGALSVSPSVITLRGNLGQSTRQRISVENGTSRVFTFRLEARDVVVRDGKRLFAPAGATPGSIAATAVFSQRNVVVRPNEKVSVDVTVTLPPETKCRAIVALFTATEAVRNVRASIGTLLTFAVTDDVSVDAGEMRVTPQSNAANASFAGPLTNSGREPVMARGVVALLDAGGRLVGKSEMHPLRLLPSERNEIRAEYAGELQPGRYRVLMTMDFEGRALIRTGELVVR